MTCKGTACIREYTKWKREVSSGKGKKPYDMEGSRVDNRIKDMKWKGTDKNRGVLERRCSYMNRVDMEEI